MLSQIYASIGSFLPQPMKQRSLNYQNLLQLLWESFLCRLFFKMIEINYVPIYMKINHIFFVIKGQFPVTDYIPNTIILYFIVQYIYVLCLFYCITCLCLSLTPPVSGLRCIVFNKVMFCSVLFFPPLCQQATSIQCVKYGNRHTGKSFCWHTGGMMF